MNPLLEKQILQITVLLLYSFLFETNPSRNSDKAKESLTFSKKDIFIRNQINSVQFDLILQFSSEH